MLGQLLLLICGAALLAAGYTLLVRREEARRLQLRWKDQLGAIAGIRVRVSNLCPPGKAYVLDPGAIGFGLSGDPELIIHPSDYRKIAQIRGL